MAATPWLALLCVATSVVLQALAQSTSGFISIDCGLPGEIGYVETGTSLPYTTDAGFIDANAGSNHKVSVERFEYSNLRSFPIGTRNCYTLGSLVAGLKYLIRAKFYYGNYDGLAVPPIFDLYVGVDFWTTVNLSILIDQFHPPMVFAEIILVVPKDSVNVCLMNTGNGVPFISGLDLRPLKNMLYPLANATQGLVLVHRFNWGQTKLITYPYDPFDRYWEPFLNWTPEPFDRSVTMMKLRNPFPKADQFQPSPEVMRTGSIGYAGGNIEFTLSLDSSPGDRSLGYIDTLYFCELQQLNSSKALREYSIYRNGFQTLEAYTPRYLLMDYVTSDVPFQDSKYVVSLNATARSTERPLINAMELFAVIPVTTSGTDSQDAPAITAIKVMYQLQKNWMGDPCVPKNVAWQGLNCSYADSKHPTITSVDVSFNGLSGAISPDFSNLKNVKYLDLSNNFLSGSIPDTLSQLPSLVFLDLSNNWLDGKIPPGLLKKVQAGSLDLRYHSNHDLMCSGNTCKGKNKLAMYIGVAAAVIATLVVLAILRFWLRRGRKQGSIKNPIDQTNYRNENISLDLEDRQFGHGNSSPELKNHQSDDENNSLESENRQFGDGNISVELENRQFTYMQLQKIMNNFERQLGRGGFGYVFHGSLDNGTEVAVKLSSHSSDQDVKQFLAEAQVLSRIHHKNLVYMIGFCTDREHMAIVYEYMPQGTLQEHIAGEGGDEQSLPWRQRLRVALESAQGLEYLHKGCSPPIIHRDVKTANILLNAKLEVKIADFGLSKAYKCEDDTHLTTNVFAGTQGYADPEYMRTMQPSTKSDVYCFGVVLLELVTGKPAILRNPEPITIIEWARRCLAQGDIESVVDSRMQGDHDINAVWKTTEIALKCTDRLPLRRPSMTDIVMQLQECLDLEESCMGCDSGYYNNSDIGGISPAMGYNATSQNSADLR